MFYICIFQIFPVIYCLTTRKTAKSYEAIFKFIEDRIFKLKPKGFMTDFEDGMRKAIRKCWRDSAIQGCWFHYCRAIFRMVRKKGLTRLHKKNMNVRTIIKSIMSLPLLPADKIREGFMAITAFARKKKLLQKLGKMFSYVESYWLNSQVCLNYQHIFNIPPHADGRISGVQKFGIQKNAAMKIIARIFWPNNFYCCVFLTVRLYLFQFTWIWFFLLRIFVHSDFCPSVFWNTEYFVRPEKTPTQTISFTGQTKYDFCRRVKYAYNITARGNELCDTAIISTDNAYIPIRQKLANAWSN